MLAYIADYISSLAGLNPVQQPAPPLLPFPQPQSVQEARENVVHICRRALSCGTRLASALADSALVAQQPVEPFDFLATFLERDMRSLVRICRAIIVEMDTDPYVGFAAFTDAIQQAEHAFLGFELAEADLYKSRILANRMSYATYSKVRATQKCFEAARTLLHSAYWGLKPGKPLPDLLEIEEYLACPDVLSHIDGKGLLAS